MCYNITRSYKSPPMVKMTAGGLEPPRQLSASSAQSYCVCLLHHAVLKSGGSAPAKMLLPLTLLILLKHNFDYLSMGKTTRLNINNDDKSKLWGCNDDCVPVLL
jgi:hypothetical protein